MQVIEDQSFDSIYDDDSASTFADKEFHRCYFESCALSIARQPALRSTIRRIRLVNCSQRGCSLDSAVVEDVVVDGFKTNGQVFQTCGAVFNRVVLRGKIDRVMISSVISYGLATPGVQEAFDVANAEYYSGVEWALDISEGEFMELCIRGLPAHLIRRDPKSQFVVTREKALQGRWKSPKFSDNLWLMSIQLFLDRGEPSIVLVAPKRHRKFREHLADIKFLQDAGIAEPD